MGRRGWLAKRRMERTRAFLENSGLLHLSARGWHCLPQVGQRGLWCKSKPPPVGTSPRSWHSWALSSPTPLLPCCWGKLSERVVAAVGAGRGGSQGLQGSPQMDKIPSGRTFLPQAIPTLARFLCLGLSGCWKWEEVGAARLRGA